MWVKLGRASSNVVSKWGDSPFSSNVHTPLGPLKQKHIRIREAATQQVVWGKNMKNMTISAWLKQNKDTFKQADSSFIREVCSLLHLLNKTLLCLTSWWSEPDWTDKHSRPLPPHSENKLICVHQKRECILPFLKCGNTKTHPWLWTSIAPSFRCRLAYRLLSKDQLKGSSAERHWGAPHTSHTSRITGREAAGHESHKGSLKPVYLHALVRSPGGWAFSHLKFLFTMFLH